MAQESIQRRIERLEQARQEGDYGRARSLAVELDRRLDAVDTTATAKSMRSRVFYNIALVKWDQAAATESNAAKTVLYRQGLEAAQESADVALEAGDLISVMYAHMIIGGHYYGSRGIYDEAFHWLEETRAETEELSTDITDAGERRRCLNLVLNCRTHLFRMSIEQKNTLLGYLEPDFEKILDLLKTLELENHPEWRKIAQGFQDYVVSARGW